MSRPRGLAQGQALWGSRFLIAMGRAVQGWSYNCSGVCMRSECSKAELRAGISSSVLGSGLCGPGAAGVLSMEKWLQLLHSSFSLGLSWLGERKQKANLGTQIFQWLLLVPRLLPPLSDPMGHCVWAS